jgi:hypothetical protein
MEVGELCCGSLRRSQFSIHSRRLVTIWSDLLIVETAAVICLISSRTLGAVVKWGSRDSLELPLRHLAPIAKAERALSMACFACSARLPSPGWFEVPNVKMFPVGVCREEWRDGRDGPPGLFRSSGELGENVNWAGLVFVAGRCCSVVTSLPAGPPGVVVAWGGFLHRPGRGGKSEVVQ